MLVGSGWAGAWAGCFIALGFIFFFLKKMKQLIVNNTVLLHTQILYNFRENELKVFLVVKQLENPKLRNPEFKGQRTLTPKLPFLNFLTYFSRMSSSS